MARFELLDRDLEWNVANMPGVQSTLRDTAMSGARKARVLAGLAGLVESGEYIDSISAGPETFAGGKRPVGDWTIDFGAPYAMALEYGHLLSGSYAGKTTRAKLKRIKGYGIARKTYKAM